MKILSTMHSHCSFCDGKNTSAEMAEKAYNLGFVSYGFSSHSHLPYKNGYAIKMDQEKLYREEILRLKKQYKGKMEILLGLELDADSPDPEFKYDYLISSVHQLHINNKYWPIDNKRAILEECIKSFGSVNIVIEEFYRRTQIAALRDNITIVGHFDLITKFNQNGDLFDPNDEKYLALAINTADTIFKKRPDIVFEVNTGAIARGYRKEPYPAMPILKHLANVGCKVMINSDTHSVETIDTAYDIALKHCKDAGFKKIYRLRKEGFEAINI